MIKEYIGLALFIHFIAKTMWKLTVLAPPELGKFLHDAVDGVRLGVVAVNNQGYFLFRVHSSREYMIFFHLGAWLGKFLFVYS